MDYHSDYYGYQSELIDIAWDITSGAPVAVADVSAELVYCSHTVEHLQDDHVDHLLAGAQRILNPGGVIRVTTPNAEQFYWAYRPRDSYINFHYGHAFPFGAGDHTYSVPRMSIWIINEVATQLVQGVGGEERRGAILRDKPGEIDAIFAGASCMEEALSKLCGMVDFELQREVPGQHVNWWTVDKIREAYRRAGFAHAVVTVAGRQHRARDARPALFRPRRSDVSVLVDAVK